MIQQKVNVILSSVRFWMVSAAALFQILKSIWPQHAEVWDILSVWLATVTAIGTADSLVTKATAKEPAPPAP